MSLKHFTDSLRSLGVTFKEMVSKPTTVEYPAVIRPRAERYRASFALTTDEHGEENCIGCKICENICPSNIITVVPGGKRESPVTGKKRAYCKDYTLDMTACIVCELCVQVCPTDAIVMLRVQEKPGFSREDLVLTKERLHDNAKELKNLAWANGTKLKAMQDPKRKSSTEVEEPAPAGGNS